MIIYRPRYKPGVSGFKGVYFEPRKRLKWRAMVRIKSNGSENKQFHIGYFATPEEASEAYINYVKKLTNESNL